MICLLAAITTALLFDQARAASKHKNHWIALTAFVSGIGIWATHFVAMLAYQSQLAIDFDPLLTLISFLLAILGGGAGWWVAASGGRLAASIGGALVGLGIAAMHYSGMAAVRMPAAIIWDPAMVVWSVALGAAFSTLALASHPPRPGRVPWDCAVLLTAAICSLHFTGMAAVTVVPGADSFAGYGAINKPTLGTIVTAAALLVFTVAIATLLMDRKLTLQSIQEARRLRRLADAGVEGLLVVSGPRVIDVNASLLELGGFSDVSRVPRRVSELLPDVDFEALASRAVQRMVESQLVRSDGSRCDVELIMRKVEWNGEESSAIAVRDITERKRSSERIAHLAYFDSLTGLANRVRFAEELERRLDHARNHGGEVAVLCLDLDGFKAVNDAHGHAVGDSLLVAVGKRLRSQIRDGDLVARLGGDEFALIQCNAQQPASAKSLSGRLLRSLEQQFRIGSRSLRIGASIGVAVFPRDGDDQDELMKCADIALYRAKSEGRDTARCYEPAMDEAMRFRHCLQSDLRLAIERDQLSVHYQPVVSVATGAVTGFEALVRWQHPDHGLISPSVFIPLAEQSGAMLKIGEWVLRQAAANAARWSDSRLTLSVNVSPLQVAQPDFARLIESILDETALDPHRLDLEVTEGVLLNDTIGAVEMLRRLAAIGITISMDDFGTGYSSLNYFRHFPFNKVKIDQSFVHDMVDNPTARAIANAIIELGHELGVTVVAEGVETEEQLALLTARRCDLVQGYLLGRPRPVELDGAMMLLSDIAPQAKAA